MLSGDRSAIVVVARIGALDVPDRLRWQRADYVRERIVRQPRRPVVVGVSRKLLVTRRGWATINAVGVGAHTRVIPRRQQGATRADRQVRLPVRTVGGMRVQFDRGTKGHPAVGGTDIINVGRVTASAVLVVNQVNEIVD